MNWILLYLVILVELFVLASIYSYGMQRGVHLARQDEIRQKLLERQIIMIYKNYEIVRAVGGTILIKKNGKIVATAYTVDEAKKMIDGGKV